MLTYTSTKWVNGSGSPLNSTNLNNIETGIDALVGAVNTHEGTLTEHAAAIDALQDVDESLQSGLNAAEAAINELKNNTSSGGILME